MLSPSRFLTIGDAKPRIPCRGRSRGAPTIVMLHEGLGSAALRGDFPDRLATVTQTTVFAYSRAGYGASSLVPLPRPLTEAERL
jgi:pimeloyl-ACP methyl ester carboxylesterase